jgi:hypothetical protein
MKSPLSTFVALTDLLGTNDRGNLHPNHVERISVVQKNTDRFTLLVKRLPQHFKNASRNIRK